MASGIKKRLKRIYVPYLLFVAVLALVWLGKGMNIFTFDWLLIVFGMQGSVVGVLGAEQTWFITSLLLCYLITPFLSKLAVWVQQGNLRLLIFLSVTGVLPFFMALLPPAYFSTLFSPACWYCLAFFLGVYFDHIKINGKYAVIAFALMCTAFGTRVVARSFVDGTIWYDRVTVPYTQTIAAFCIFYIFAYVFQNCKPIKPVAFLSTISFEIYLYHYMFCVGPVKLFGITHNWVLDCVLVTIVTVIVSTAANKLVRLVTTFKLTNKKFQGKN